MTKIGIYPGTFDPVTYGHLDVVHKATCVVDTLIVAVAEDIVKNPLFSIAERKAMMEHEIAGLNQQNCIIKVVSFRGLLVDFAKQHNAKLIIRGLRAVSDFEYEFQMSCMNLKLAPEIQTILLPASERTHFVSSRFAKEIARLGGDISEIVSENVRTELTKKYHNLKI